MNFCSSQSLNPTFILSEDGSKDETLIKLKELSNKFDIRLITAPYRKGYSRAVVDAILAAENGILCCVDSDGQCDPNDLEKLLLSLRANSNKIISGVRTPRMDSNLRKVMSRLFGIIYILIFKIRMRDTSCPFVVGFRENFNFVKYDIKLNQGFWWEFHARRVAAKIEVIEVEVNHRQRIEGVSRVYSIKSITKIAFKHLFGLLSLRRSLKTFS